MQKQLSAAAALFLVGFAFCWGVAEADLPRPLSFPSDKVSLVSSKEINNEQFCRTI